MNPFDDMISEIDNLHIDRCKSVYWMMLSIELMDGRDKEFILSKIKEVETNIKDVASSQKIQKTIGPYVQDSLGEWTASAKEILERLDS